YIRVRPLTLFCVRVTPPTLFYTLSLHDALPIFMFLNIRQKAQELIYHEALSNRSILSDKEQRKLAALSSGHAGECEYDRLFDDRSEEHTSELQSRFDLVCRLLLEKKN